MDLVKLFNVVVSLSLMGSLVFLLIIIIKGLFKNKLSAHWHYYIWFLLLIRLIIPNTPESPLSIFNILPSSSSSIEISQNTSMSYEQVNAPSKTTSEHSAINQDAIIKASNIQKGVPKSENTHVPEKNPIGINYNLLSIIWLIGAVGFILYILSFNTRYLLKVNKQSRYKEGAILSLFEKAKEEMNVRINIPIIYDRNLATPSLFGIFRPKLLLPNLAINTLSEEEKRFVFLHELAHFKRKDNLLNWILVLIQAIHWFNPIVWYAFYKIREDSEVACDAYVLSRLKYEEHKEYGETIINMVKKVSKPSLNPITTGMAKNKSSVKKRIEMVTKFKENSWKWSIIAVFIVATLGIVGLTNSISNESPLYKYIDKSTDFDILLIQDNEGNVTIDLETLDEEHWTREDIFQLETRILLDAIKHFLEQEQNDFKKITIRAITKKTERVFYTASVNGDTLMNHDWTKMESFEVPYYADYYYYSKNWEQVSRNYGVQGKIVNMDTTDSKLNSIKIEVKKNINLPNNPIEFDFTGNTLEVVFTEELMNAGMFKDKLKEGSEIVVTFAQYAIPPDGKVVDGANLRSIYYYENGKYYDIRGKEISSLEQHNRLSPFNGTVTKIQMNKELRISDEKWLETKRRFLEKHQRGEFSKEINNLEQTNFKTEEIFQGNLNGEYFELVLYRNNPFSVLYLKFGNKETTTLLQDFYYTPWVFYEENVRFQIFAKGVGASYNIPLGEFVNDKASQEIELFDKLYGGLIQLQNTTGLISGNEVDVGGNKAKLLGGYSLMIK